MDIRDLLHKYGFYIVESSTLTYSHKTLRPTLSICRINDKSKKTRFKVNTDKDWDISEEVITPFQITPDNEKVVIRTEEELIKYYSII